MKFLVFISAIVVLSILVFPVTDFDIWFHLEDGKSIVENRQAPTKDLYSYTAQGNPVISNSWGFAAASYLIYKAAGLQTLNAIKAFFAFLIFLAIIYYLHKKKWLNLASLTFVVFSFFLMRPNFNLRPHTISFLLFTIFLILLFEYKEKRNYKYIFLIALTQLLWVNVHASFVLGLGFAGLFVLSDTVSQRKIDKKNVVLISLVFLASLINFFYGYQFLIKTISDYFAPAEFHPPIREFIKPDIRSFLSVEGIVLISGWIITALYSFKKRRFDILLILLSITVISLNGSRFLRYLMLFLCLTAPAYFKEIPIPKIKFQLPQKVLAASYLIFLFGIFIAAKNSPLGIGLGLDKYSYPVKAVEFMEKENLLGRSNGNLYNTYNFGGYLIWALYPEHKVFLDGRVEPYVGNSKVFANYWSNFEGGDPWKESVNKYNITVALMTPPHVNSNTLYDDSSRMFPNEEWAPIYFDDNALIYVKRIPELRDVINNFEYKTLNPQEVNIAYLGDKVKDEESFNNAMKETDRALSLNPDSYKLHFALAYLFGIVNAKDQMTAELNKTLEINPYFQSAREILKQVEQVN